MYTLLVVLFILVCILMVVAILMQASKGGGLASSFGGMGSAGGVLGARGAASFLQKVTIGFAIAFGLLSMAISFLSRPASELPESATQEKLRTEQQAIPGTPAPIAQPQADSGAAQ